MTTFSETYLDETAAIVRALDTDEIERLAGRLAEVRARQGRLFILGVGGSAAHAGHAVNDFRKLCGFEAYAPTDNVSELTARVNDEGWDGAFSAWLRGSRISARDAVLVFSVGGGSEERGISTNIVRAIGTARDAGADVLGIVGRDGGTTRALADASVLVPPLFADRVTPHTEGLCAVVWHLLVSHPLLRRSEAKWESVAPVGERS
ncbi:MAG TPA: SIS domain-containing protein [Candidatus Eisenbacteria bacterium]|nr:SIS domain-containing protein [Candidatus Eisenbacteria bacterium]